MNTAGEAVARGINKLGWHWWPSDNAISSVYYDGREPDRGAFLRSFSSSDIIYWPKAISAGAVLKTNSRVREILIDKQGQAVGALYYDKDGELHQINANIVIIACNGIGTARLLLNSKSGMFPNGLANSSGQVGKNLMHHPCGGVIGIFEENFGSPPGPRGSSMLCQEFYETDPNRNFVRGYSFQMARSNGPAHTALGTGNINNVMWGKEHHNEFKRRFKKSLGMAIISEDLPELHNRVEIDESKTDKNGIPLPKIFYKMLKHKFFMLLLTSLIQKIKHLRIQGIY